MISLEIDAFEPPAYLRGMARPGSATPDFPQQLAAVRKQRSLTQQALAERIGVNVVQLRRYEADASGPAAKESQR